MPGLGIGLAAVTRESFMPSGMSTMIGARKSEISDFTKGSIPAGWITPDLSGVSGYAMEFSWSDADENSSGDYFWLKGDSGNPKTHYPLRYGAVLQGDYLFQLSFHAGDITCRDWGIAVSPDDATSVEDTQWQWQWGTNETRIAVQANCANPTIYGTSASVITEGANLNTDSGWFTYHMYHRPSVPSTTLTITNGQNDWELEGDAEGNTVFISEAIVGVGENYWFGIGGDWDFITGQPWAKASAARILSLIHI